MVVSNQLRQALKRFGLTENATKKQLKSAYLAAARKVHPDVTQGNDEKFKQVQKDFELAEDLLDLKEGKQPKHGRATGQDPFAQGPGADWRNRNRGPWPDPRSGGILKNNSTMY